MTEPHWPSVDAQLAEDRVAPGTALERLIRENQEFHLLRPEEANDRIDLPLWLRVYFRKQRPDLDYREGDPTGGYPLVLERLHEWMVANQDLPRGSGPSTSQSARISGA